MGFEVRKKRKYRKAEKFVTKIKEIQEEAKAVLGKAQEEIKKYANRKRAEVNEYKVRDLVMLSTMLQLHYGQVVTYCMVYHYTKRAKLARLLANEGLAIYVVL